MPWSEITALLSVVLIDIVLAGDNAVVVGMAAAGVAREQRRRVIFWGIAAATVMRIVFAFFTYELLAIVGLTLAGGILLLWVSWKFWREIRESRTHSEQDGAAALADGEVTAAPKSFRAAVTQIVMADVSMSLDNVLAVAGAAQEHPWIMLVGLSISVVLMGLAASLIARLLQRWHWIAYVGLGVIAIVAVSMIWRGTEEVLKVTGTAG
ncbi:TerC family protein [Zavarzinia sp. CC-PAN008]|uniref:TerC family protein n=1 Tax=Zavarzinia sp. CC-PAN008 TaxID=3243332 RepID=UPI003F748F0C